ncbi:PREDICTED: very low-density lipoprotein receptor-like [Cyprinodon variegatus]|uniref:very low-density lipoprotein receptor-like n=1 Tax=Cyprinodon variegatus TaxID=28743 RepID=UPI000742604A|nr:PREDICTED: very low-density lipoprotein receptor-like [Cyprinodon variegatus]
MAQNASPIDMSVMGIKTVKMVLMNRIVTLHVVRDNFITIFNISPKTDQFQCAHGKKCIDKDQVCDGESQCQDRSDEENCLKHPEDCAHHCDDKSQCLPASFICDGEKDCVDGTDEANCADHEKMGATESPVQVPSGLSHPLRCGLGSQMCEDKSDCVHYRYVCDGEPDCVDGSDEKDCSSECGNDQFQCAHGKMCIEKSKVCDGVPQCQDHSDELECAKRMEGCAHMCDDNSRCVPDSFLCDGEKDCGDGSDEAACADVRCSTSEFKCVSGQCVLASMHCDGHPDCWDRSDEEGCTKPPECTTKHRCPHSKECLVQEWICDGDQDCKDGSDEKDCPVLPVSCGSFQWLCKSKTLCIPGVWRCDGMRDCDDGSDETECGTKACPAYKFQCGNQECLESALVCNGVTNCADGSDEGGSCQMACTADDDNRCSQGCYSTPQGPRCLCTKGYRLMEDKHTCADIDECEPQAQRVCSHLCINTPGSYRCECHPGFIMEADGYQCKITGEPFLLMSVQTELYMYGLRSRSLDILASSAQKAILSIDYDWRDQKVFWVSVDTETIRWSSMDQKTAGILIKGVRADSVAVDWLGRNLYWIDGVNSQIVAVKLLKTSVKSLDQSIILEEDLDQPRSLALLPQKGLMFWTEIGNLVKIERAGMDGSERKAVVNSSLGWPGGIAVDMLSERIFWTDERLGAIGSATLDGDEIKVFQLKETTNPFSVTVFNDLLFWSDAKKRVVQAVDKLSGKNRQVILKRPGQPFSVKIIHPIIQMDTESPCKKMACSHICLLAPRRKAVCKCPPGLSLAEDGLTCSSLVKSTFLLLLSPPTVTKIYLQSQQVNIKGWPEHLALQIPSIGETRLLDYSTRENTLILTGDDTTSVNSYKLKDKTLVAQGQLLKLLDDQITAVALDWVTLNVYWSSNKQTRLHVTSKTGAYTAILIKEGLTGVSSIALHPQTGKMCFTNLDLKVPGKNAAIECAHMDGGEHKVVSKQAFQPASLAFSSNGDTIYWANTGSGTIGLIKTDGSGYQELEAGAGLSAVAIGDNVPIWMTVDDMTRLWYREDQQQKLWFEVDSKVMDLKAFKSTQSGSNQCAKNNGNCEHLCLATPSGRTCNCAHDFIAKDATCSPSQICSPDTRQCLDQTCLPAEKFCDGHADCSDNSDENCSGVEQGSGTKAASPRSPQSTLSPHTVPPKEGKNSLEDGSEIRNLEAQQCDQDLCNGNGKCVETNGVRTCECLDGYTGVSCQDDVKSMQGPIIYGAAGLCGIIVIIAVMAVVLKKNAASRSTPEATMDTSMSDLEKKVESPSTKNAQAASEKEEPVSSVD